MTQDELAQKIQDADRALQQESAEAARVVQEHVGRQLGFCRRLIAVFRAVLDEKQTAFPDTGWQMIVMSLLVKVLATVRAAHTLAAAGHAREIGVVTRSALESLITALFIAKEDAELRARRWADHAVVGRAQLLKKIPDLSAEPAHLEMRDRILAMATELEKHFPNRFFWASGLSKGSLRDLAIDVGMEWYHTVVYWSGSQATHGSAISVEAYLGNGADRTPIYHFGLSVDGLYGELAVCCDILVRALALLDAVLELGLGELITDLVAEYKAAFGAETAEEIGASAS